MKFFFERDFARAGQELKNAIALNPNDGTAYQAHSVPLGAMKRYDESVAEARRGLEVDPLSIPVNNIVGELISTARQWPQAIEPYRRTIELDPNVALVRDNLGIALEEIADHDQAIEEYVKARSVSGDENFRPEALRSASQKHGMRGFREKQPQFALEHWTGRHIHAFQIASLYARLADPALAMAWLQKAVDARSGMLIWLHMYADFEDIRFALGISAPCATHWPARLG